jgi:hypothetical protein
MKLLATALSVVLAISGAAYAQTQPDAGGTDNLTEAGSLQRVIVPMALMLAVRTGAIGVQLIAPSMSS